MRRTAQLEHDIVGNIDQSRDRTHAAALQARLHPIRRRSGSIQAAKNSARKAAAKVGRLNIHRKRAGASGSNRIHRRQRERRTGNRMHIACDADHGERIAAIGGELEFDLGIVKTCVLTDIDAHRRIIGQDPNTIVIFVDAEFARRTEHAHRNHTAQLALFDAEVAGEHGTDRSAGDFDAGYGIHPVSY